MAGIPPLGGFIAKEYVYEATLAASPAELLTGLAVMANVALVAVAGLVGVRPFVGAAPSDSAAKEAGAGWLGPIVLAALGLAIGLAPGPFGDGLVGPAVAAVLGAPASLSLALWHGWTPMLGLSLVTLVAGVALFLGGDWSRRLGQAAVALGRWGPERGYQMSLDGLLALARWQTRVLQSGYLRVYVLLVLVTTVVLAGTALVVHAAVRLPAAWPVLPVHEWLIIGVILAATVMVTITTSRLAAVAALGVVGYAIALLFLLYSGPDLAMTLVAIETLTVILFVLILYRLPRFAVLSNRVARVRDALVALTVGGSMTVLMLTITATPLQSRLTPFFVDSSVPLAFGRNIVNVILVDFRSLDTMGEIAVLALAAIGVYALMRLRPHQGDT